MICKVEEISNDRELKSDNKWMCYVLCMLINTCAGERVINTSIFSNYGLVSEKDYTPYQD